MENGEYEADSDYDGDPTLEQFREEQHKDPYTHHIITAITDLDQDAPQSEADRTWAQLNQSNFAIKDGTLYKAWIKGKGQHAKTQWQVVVPRSLQTQVIQAYHSSKRNSHYGDLKTFAQLRENFTWNSAFSDVR